MPVSFFCKTTAANIWKTVVCVSNAGAKRGRGKGTGKKQIVDFNLKQRIGYGTRRLNMPAINAPVLTKEAKVTELNQDQNYQIQPSEDLFERVKGRRKFLEKPNERGWSGKKMPGRLIGPPDEYNETEFEGFNSTVLMLRNLEVMGSRGRIRVARAIVVTGNGRGLAGFAQCKGKDPRSTLRKARNRAGQSLIAVPLYENRTVMHDFFSKYYQTTVFVAKKPEGYGIVAHRVIRAICKAYGIKDLYAKIEGVSQNTSNLVKAFFLGLINQKSYQDIANEKQLHLVELQEERSNFPKLLASPQGKVRTEEEIKATKENLDFTYYIYDGKIKQATPEKKFRWLDDPGYQRHLDLMDYTKNTEMMKIKMAARYGNRRVLDVFPAFHSNADTFKKED